MQDLYVLGGAQKAAFKDAQEEWLLYERAVVARICTEAGTGNICCSYQSPVAVRASAESSVLFKAGALEGDRLYACTSTEVMVFQVPSFRRLAWISLPMFNDLHHVRPAPNGSLEVVVTGLDMVAEITLQGEVVHCWSALGEDPWRRFSPTTDYRRVNTLKPYQTHANFVFWAQDELWVTRGDLGDAICLTDPERRIVLGTSECIHDGWLRDGYIYFTSVDGHIYVVSERTLRVEDRVDLNVISRDGGYSWCRGILPADSHRVWVGFTRIRSTRWKERIRWIKGMVSTVSRPTRLALYDLAARRLLKEIPLEALGMHAVFNALPVPTAPSADHTTEPRLHASHPRSPSRSCGRNYASVRSSSRA